MIYKKDFKASLKKLKNNELNEIPNKPLHLIPGYPYLFYNVETDFDGRKVYHNVNVTAGYYHPQVNEDESEITLMNAMSIDYSSKGEYIEPLNYIVGHPEHIDLHKKKLNYYIDYYTKIYKLDLPPIHVEHVPKMKEMLEEARWVPTEENKYIPFIGETYRMKKESFEKKHRKSKSSQSSKSSSQKSKSNSNSKTRKNKKP